MGPPLAFAHLLGGAMLVLSFGLLYQRRLAALINVYAVQAWVLAAAAGWLGWTQRAPELGATGLVVLGASGVAMPIVLRRLTRRPPIDQVVETALGVFPSMAAGAVLVALAVLVVLPTATDGQLLSREDLVLALSVVLLGLLTMITRRTALAQAVGFLSIGNGLLLGAVAASGMPLVMASSVAVLVLGGTLVSGVLFLGIRHHPGEPPR